MKEVWQELPLGELTDILDYRRRPITKKDRTPGDVPYYGASGVLDHVGSSIFDEPLVLIGEDGAKWEAGERSAFAIVGPSWINNHAHVLRPRRDKISDAWLIYYLNWTDLTPFVSGLTVRKLNQESLRSIPVLVPPLPEQERIVSVLDEVFDAIATATENTDTALRRAAALYRANTSSLLQRGGSNWHELPLGDLCEIARGGSPRPIQSFLTDRSDGVNWIKIGDASASGRTILRTEQKIKPEGVSRSRRVYAGDLLLSNSMSFGRPYILGTDGCIHDGWLVLGGNPTRYDQTYLYHLLGSEAVYSQFDRLAAGSTVRNLNINLVSSVVVQLPPLEEQREIAREIDRLEVEIDTLKALLARKQTLLVELKQAILAHAFSGELTAAAMKPFIATSANDNDYTTPEQVANLIASAHRRHEAKGRGHTFGRVKAQKNLYLVESVAKVELGRRPKKDAAGPNDFPHMLAAEDWAKVNGFFEFRLRRGGGYDFKKLSNYRRMIVKAEAALAPVHEQIERATDLIVNLDSEGAEVLATVHAAWNNLVLDGAHPSDDEIVREARDEWHADKLRIPATKFRQAIKAIRQLAIVPDGTAKRVGEPKLL